MIAGWAGSQAILSRSEQAPSALSGALPAQVHWADIAFTYGYFDLAHLTQDFRAFVDSTLTEYLAQRSFHPCHVVLFY